MYSGPEIHGFSPVRFGDETCVACPAGSYSKLDATSCALCLANTYQDTEAAAACKQCPGHSVSEVGSASVSSLSMRARAKIGIRTEIQKTPY